MDSGKKIVPTVKRENIDNGRAWIVLIAAYIGLLIHTMTFYMNGVVYLALLQQFNEGVTKTSIVVTLSSSVLCFGNPVASYVTNKYSTRITLIIGGILSTIGYAGCAFVSNINGAIVTIGVLVGAGQGFIVSGCLCTLGFYFDRYRNLAMSVCFLIPGVGLFISTPIAIAVSEKFGLSCLFLVCASLTVQVCLIGVICRPSDIELDLQTQRNVNLNSKTKKGLASNIGGFDLLKRRDFLCLLFTQIAWGFSLITSTTHIPNYISVSGGSDSDIEIVMMFFAISNTIGRAAGILIINCFDNHSLSGYTLSFLSSAILTLTFPLYSSSLFGIYGFAAQAAFFVGIPNANSFTGEIRWNCQIVRSKWADLFLLWNWIWIRAFRHRFRYEYSFLVAGAVLLVGALCGFAAQKLERKQVEQHNDTSITLEIQEES